MNTESQSLIICPYCFYVLTDSWDYEAGEVACERCEKPFVFDCDVEITYTTRKIEDGTDTEPT